MTTPRPKSRPSGAGSASTTSGSTSKLTARRSSGRRRPGRAEPGRRATSVAGTHPALPRRLVVKGTDPRLRVVDVGASRPVARARELTPPSPHRLHAAAPTPREAPVLEVLGGDNPGRRLDVVEASPDQIPSQGDV